MNFVNGNLLNYNRGIIGHQVNCQLVMGAGLAKQIRAKYPKVFDEYKKIFGKISLNKRLGKCQIVEIETGTLYVANLFGQVNYLPRHTTHTDHIAITRALRQMAWWRDRVMGSTFPIYLPYGLGCGLAGGNWNQILATIKDVIPNAIIVKLPPSIMR